MYQIQDYQKDFERERREWPIYQQAAGLYFKDKLDKSDLRDDYYRGIDGNLHHSGKTIQFKCHHGDKTVDGINLGIDAWDIIPFEFARRKNEGDTWKPGNVYHTEANYYIVIRLNNRETVARVIILDWDKVKKQIPALDCNTFINKWGTGKNRNVKLTELEEGSILDDFKFNISTGIRIRKIVNVIKRNP
jgi:hypothetical protein